MTDLAAIRGCVTTLNVWCNAPGRVVNDDYAELFCERYANFMNLTTVADGVRLVHSLFKETGMDQVCEHVYEELPARQPEFKFDPLPFVIGALLMMLGLLILKRPILMRG